jgi:hypothetical protein
MMLHHCLAHRVLYEEQAAWSPHSPTEEAA